MKWIWCLAVPAAMLAQGQGVNFYSREKEMVLGQRLADDFRAKTTPLGNAEVSGYVEHVGAKLAAELPGGWTYQFAVVREDVGGPTHEPVVFPGGHIFVSRELIAAVRDEAEFVGMLAHAMGHVVGRHWTKQATKNELTQIGSAPVVMMGGWQQGGTVPLGMAAFVRANEREADYLAVKAMAAAGYDPAGLASYIGRTQVEAGGTAKVFSAFPDKKERVAAIEAEIGKLPARKYSDGAEFLRVTGK